MFWNHRVIVKMEHDGVTPYFAIHECFYDVPAGVDVNDSETLSKLLPHSWTDEPIAVYGDNIDGLKVTLNRMLVACGKPILIEKDDKLEEWK